MGLSPETLQKLLVPPTLNLNNNRSNRSLSPAKSIKNDEQDKPKIMKKGRRRKCRLCCKEEEERDPEDPQNAYRPLGEEEMLICQELVASWTDKMKNKKEVLLCPVCIGPIQHLVKVNDDLKELVGRVEYVITYPGREVLDVEEEQEDDSNDQGKGHGKEEDEDEDEDSEPEVIVLDDDEDEDDDEVVEVPVEETEIKYVPPPAPVSKPPEDADEKKVEDSEATAIVKDNVEHPDEKDNVEHLDDKDKDKETLTKKGTKLKHKRNIKEKEDPDPEPEPSSSQPSATSETATPEEGIRRSTRVRKVKKFFKNLKRNRLSYSDDDDDDEESIDDNKKNKTTKAKAKAELKNQNKKSKPSPASKKRRVPSSSSSPPPELPPPKVRSYPPAVKKKKVVPATPRPPVTSTSTWDTADLNQVEDDLDALEYDFDQMRNKRHQRQVEDKVRRVSVTESRRKQKFCNSTTPTAHSSRNVPVAVAPAKVTEKLMARPHEDEDEEAVVIKQEIENIVGGMSDDLEVRMRMEEEEEEMDEEDRLLDDVDRLIELQRRNYDSKSSRKVYTNHEDSSNNVDKSKEKREEDEGPYELPYIKEEVIEESSDEDLDEDSLMIPPPDITMSDEEDDTVVVDVPLPLNPAAKARLLQDPLANAASENGDDVQVVCFECGELVIADLLHEHIFIEHVVKAKPEARQKKRLEKLEKRKMLKAGRLSPTYIKQFMSECPECGTLIAKASLKRHLILWHGPSEEEKERVREIRRKAECRYRAKKPYKCTECPEGYGWRPQLVRHMKLMHGIMPVKPSKVDDDVNTSSTQELKPNVVGGRESDPGPGPSSFSQQHSIPKLMTNKINETVRNEIMKPQPTKLEARQSLE